MGFLKNYIEKQRVKGKSPGAAFFMIPGAKGALKEAMKDDKTRTAVEKATAGRSIPKEAPKAAPKDEKLNFSGTKDTLKSRKDAIDQLASPNSFSKGGMVKKTGMAKVHAGEKVLTKSQTKKMSKKMSK